MAKRMIGLDVGTSFLIASTKKDNKEVYNMQRDCYFVIPEDKKKAIKMAESSGGDFIYNEDRGEYYLIGQDAINFVNLLSTFMDKEEVDKNRMTQLKRPMSLGVLNPKDKLGAQMLEVLIEGVVEGAVDDVLATGEGIVYFSVPADPVDGNFNTIFHTSRIEQKLENLGYVPHALNEGLAVIYSEAPSVEVDGVDVPFSGLGISFGGGMVNVCFSYRGMALLEYSTSRAGDWLDEQVAQVTNTPVSVVTRYKEEHLDLSADLSSDEMLNALYIFYDNLIKYVLHHLKRELSGMEDRITYEVPIVIAGGTSKPKGFVDLFKKRAEKENLPFKIKEVITPSEPSYAVAKGCLVAALADSEEDDEDIEDSQEEEASNI